MFDDTYRTMAELDDAALCGELEREKIERWHDMASLPYTTYAEMRKAYYAAMVPEAPKVPWKSVFDMTPEELAAEEIQIKADLARQDQEEKERREERARLYAPKKPELLIVDRKYRVRGVLPSGMTTTIRETESLDVARRIGASERRKFARVYLEASEGTQGLERAWKEVS